MTYKEFLQNRISKQEFENHSLPLELWKALSLGKTYSKRKKQNSTGVQYYKSFDVKIKHYREKYKMSEQQLGQTLSQLEGIALDQTLDLWAVKPERQNLNERWKKEYIEEHSSLKVKVLPKFGPKSVYLDSNFNLKSKTKSHKTMSDSADEMKTFDYGIQGIGQMTEGFPHLLTVDKTTKISGGSQSDTLKIINTELTHLNKDPKKRTYGVILDGDFWIRYREEIEKEYPNIIILSSDIIRKKYPKDSFNKV